MVGRIVIMVLVLSVAPAMAQPPGQTPVIEVREPPRPPAKKIWVAYALSLGTFAVGMGSLSILGEEYEGRNQGVVDAAGIGATGALLIAPSLGHWYAGTYVTPGLVLRTAGLGAIGLMAWQHPRCSDESCMPEWLAIIGLMGVIGGGVAWDLATIPRTVLMANKRARASMQVAPLMLRSGGGLALAGTF